ncbi:MAG TPA: PQQ-binding-like beta-propeller repeat protein [Gammaproteobacteria bacterium]|nr:PQQ-binding-like beta-propeller repeat protein [Gammaproteobacteria bacterium]
MIVPNHPLRSRLMTWAALLLAGCGGTSSSNFTITPPAPVLSTYSVLTYHNDNARDGVNNLEKVLTPVNVNAVQFGKIGFFAVDGKVDAQPLFLPSLQIANDTHNVLYVATEHDSLYALDADTGTVLWHASLLRTGETPSDDRGCSQVTPEIGITATPIIDPMAGSHGVIYLVAMSKDGSGHYFQRLYALDVTTGAEMPGSPVAIQATYPGSGDNSIGGSIVFDPAQYEERAGLLRLNNTIYLTWASHCDNRPYTGWIMGYDQTTLAQASVLNISPNGEGASIWQSGAGPAADSECNIYFLAANGTFDTSLDANGFPSQGDYGNAFMKLSTVGGKLAVADYFTMTNTLAESAADEDLGSGGAILLPDLQDASGTTRHLAVGAGKDQTIYVPNRDNMGKWHSFIDHIWQEIPSGLAGSEFATPAYFNGVVYYGAVGDVLRAFRITDATLSTSPVSQTIHSFPYPGATPSISANGTADGIVWVAENGSVAGLYAYDAANLAHELYDSNQSGSRDQFGAGNKFITPTVVNGKVYVGTTDGVAVFGLLH